jgi:hypothetical protein
MKTLLPILMFAFATLMNGCANSDPDVSSGIVEAQAKAAITTDPVISRSGFDDAKTVTTVPHANTRSSSVLVNTGLGAQWNAARPDDVILIVEIFSLKNRQGLPEAELTGITGAELNIDGEKITLQPTGTVPAIDDNFLMKEYTNGFETKLSTIDNILKSKRTWLRVLTPTGTVENAVIDNGTASGAYDGLKKFMAAVEAP